MKGKAVITAKWKSTCAETGRTIEKGDPMVYDYDTKKCYARGSKTQIEFVNRDAGGDMLDAQNEQAEQRFNSHSNF